METTIPNTNCKAFLIRIFLFVALASLLFQNTLTAENTIRYSVFSGHIGDSVICQVKLPESYSGFQEQKYPVLYLLDGNLNFELATSVIKIMSRGIQPFIPEMIVVGITSSNRLRDFTPTQALYHNDGTPAPPTYQLSGQAGRFNDFLAKELKPYLDQTYRTNGYNILFGHSLGGIFGLHVLLHRQSFFNAFILADPSIWWDRTKLLSEADSLLQQSFAGKSVYHAIGHTTTIPPGTETMLQVEGNQAIAGKIEKHSENGLRFSSYFYAGETHGTVVVPALQDALKFIFQGYFVNPRKETFTTAQLETAVNQVSKNLGIQLIPQAPHIETIARYCLTILNNPQKAADFYRMGLHYYPENEKMEAGLKKCAHHSPTKQNEIR
ncbi:MAG: alpha/beta hydrolase [Prolixibacteraceae bacterium]|nr:alpha/beta hydrolase [Prolixibacteraceae bacterium]